MSKAMMNKATGLVLLVSMLVGCVAETAPAPMEEEDPIVQEDPEDKIAVVVRDSVTGMPLADALVCTQDYEVNCGNTNALGVARLRRSEGEAQLTYWLATYRVHRFTIAEETWTSSRDSYEVPAVSNATLSDVLQQANATEEEFTGFVLTPNAPDTTVEPGGDGPVEEMGDWLLFANLDTGPADVALGATCGSLPVSIESGLVTVVTDVACE